MGALKITNRFCPVHPLHKLISKKGGRLGAETVDLLQCAAADRGESPAARRVDGVSGLSLAAHRRGGRRTFAARAHRGDGGLHVVEGLAVEFAEIELGLLGADEG